MACVTTYCDLVVHQWLWIEPNEIGLVIILHKAFLKIDSFLPKELPALIQAGLT